jgi:hypothetical protein
MDKCAKRQAIYVQPNNEARSCNYCSKGKTIIIVNSEYVFVDLDTQLATRMCRIVICGLSGSTIYFHMSHKGKIFEKKY